jgi:hypothetical protein
VADAGWGVEWLERRHEGLKIEARLGFVNEDFCEFKVIFGKSRAYLSPKGIAVRP